MLDFLVVPFNLFVVHPLMNGLVGLYLLLFRDLGLAIVVLTVAIRLAVYPLFVTQLRSQRVMQELQPAIAELKRRYKDDRQGFAEAQMKLYRDRGYNPASGCFPMLIQLPILIGLYSALQQVGCGLGPPPDCPGLTAAELDSVLYPFVPNPVQAGGHLDLTAHWLPWITDGLAKPEPVPWKVLTLLAGATQLAASLMTLTPKAPATDDPMQRSMQSMVYYFPLVTVWIAWNFPAGLALYWVVTTIFSIVQQYFVSGWGKLGVFLPFLESLPAPARPLAPRQEAMREVTSNPGPANPTEKRRRKRRR